MSDADELTRLLRHWSGGDDQAGERLLAKVYDQLKGLSRSQLAKHGGSVTLQATELVHEAYLRLARQHSGNWIDRAHFFALASTVMRRVLIDHARRRHAHRRDRRLEVRLESDDQLMSPQRATELLELDGALTELAELDARKARVVELRHFGGLTVDESAEILEISPATVKREWSLARAWLYRRLNETDADSG